MKFTRTIGLASAAFVALSPSVLAVTSCIGAMNAFSDVPARFLQHMRTVVCDAGCQPDMKHWAHKAKGQILSSLIADGAQYIGFDNEKAFGEVSKLVDALQSTIETKCNAELGEGHLCRDPELLQPFVDCCNLHSPSAVRSNLAGLIPYMSSEVCRKAEEYLTSSKLWEEDFPKHMKAYVGQCHEL